MPATTVGRRSAIAGALAGLSMGARLRHARAEAAVKIGVLTDESGPYADSGGPGSVLAARMAAADFGGSLLGHSVEIVHADTQNKPDVAGAVARQWYDTEGVDAIVDLPVTPIALAVQQAAREKRRTVMITGAAITDFTQKLCAPVSTHWADDTHAMTTGTAREVVREGGKTWFFITVDFSFGKALEAAAKSVIEADGGRVLGSAYFPIGNTDFSAQLVAAQSSRADVIGLASVGNDQVNVIKQAAEFGIQGRGRQRLAGFLVYITDIHALGLPICQGLAFTSGFYWDQTDAARSFSKRFHAEQSAMPTREQAATYVASLHFLKSMAQAGTRDPLAVARAMRVLPVDYLGHPATVRGDGRVLYDLTLYRVKPPRRSRSPWDYYEPLATIVAAEAFLPQACG